MFGLVPRRRNLFCKADALADATTLAAYTEWVKGLLTPIPDGQYALKAFAMDEGRGRCGDDRVSRDPDRRRRPRAADRQNHCVR